MSSQVQAPYVPARADVWLVNFNPTLGHEQAGIRPAVILSTTQFNQGPAQLAVVVPMTKTYRGIPIHIEVPPPEGGVRQVSYAMCDQIRTVSTSHRLVTRWGAVGTGIMTQIEYAVKVVLAL